MTGFAAASPAFSAADFQLERLTPREMHVAPGAETTYILRITNAGDKEAIAHLGDGMHDPYLSYDDYRSYTLVPGGAPDCGPLGTRYTDFLNDWQFIFDAGPIGPGAHIDCSLSIARNLSSRNDVWMTWGVLVMENGIPSYQRYVETALIGTLTDASVAVHYYGFHIDGAGFAHAVAELRVHNGGSYPLNPTSVGACEDTSTRPFFTDGSGSGGCGPDFYHPSCFDWGYGFATPKIAANSTYSCRIRLTSIEPYTSPLAFPIALDRGRYGSGFTFIDTDTGNDQTLLRLQPDPPSDPGAR